MQNFIECQNIIAFKARLDTECDPATRATLLRLLAEEEAKHLARTRSGSE